MLLSENRLDFLFQIATVKIFSASVINELLPLEQIGKFSAQYERGEIPEIVSPEAAAGGPVILAEEGDLIDLDVDECRLDIAGVKGRSKAPEEMDAAATPTAC